MLTQYLPTLSKGCSSTCIHQKEALQSNWMSIVSSGLAVNMVWIHKSPPKIQVKGNLLLLIQKQEHFLLLSFTNSAMRGRNRLTWTPDPSD